MRKGTVVLALMGEQSPTLTISPAPLRVRGCNQAGWHWPDGCVRPAMDNGRRAVLPPGEKFTPSLLIDPVNMSDRIM